MSAGPTVSAQPRNLTDAVRARQARRGARPGASKSRPISSPKSGRRREGPHRTGAARGAEAPRGAGATRGAGGENQRVGRASWLSRLLEPLKWLGRTISDVLEALLGDRGDQLRRLGALVAAGWLAKRLPGPLRSISRLLTSGLAGDRGFGFWWLAVTLAIALGIGAILTVVVSPVAGIIALLAVGIWMLVQRARKSGDDDQGEGDARGGTGDADGAANRV